MMKKLLCALLIAVLCATFAWAEEDGVRISIRGYEIEQATETEVRLHLLLRKEGTAAYTMEELQVSLLDASGQALEAEQEYLVFPMKSIPAGSHYLPITLRFTLSQPGQAADFAVRGVVGSQSASSDVVQCQAGVPWLGFMQGDVMGVTTWLPLEEGTAAEDYFISIAAVNADGNFCGNAELPLGSARRVSEAELGECLLADFGLTQEMLSQMGFTFGAQEYAYFEKITMPWMPELPADLVATGYRRVRAQEQASQPLMRMTDRIDMQPDGAFLIQGVLEGTADGLWQLAGFESLTLIGADGSEISVQDFSYDTPFTTVEEGGFLPYMLKGRAPEGFEAVDFRIVFGVAPAHKADMRMVKGGGITPGLDGDGHVLVGATIPLQEGVTAEKCFVCIMFLDVENDVYQGAVWTYPGEGWVQDGAVCLPQMEASESCTLDALMAAVYCVAE